MKSETERTGIRAETRGILEDHDHDANVAQHLDIVPHRRLLCLAGHGRIVVACRSRTSLGVFPWWCQRSCSSFVPFA